MATKKLLPEDRKYLSDDPTEQQLVEREQLKQWIQAQWTELERDRRRCGFTPGYHKSEYLEPTVKLRFPQS